MNAKRIFVTMLIAVLLLPALVSCTLDEDWTTEPPCLSHKDPDGNMICDICGETSLEAGEGVEYLDYLHMTAEQQEAFIMRFENLDAFVQWHYIVKTAYDEANKGEDLGGDGDIIIGGGDN